MVCSLTCQRNIYEFAGLAHHPAGEVHLSECYMGHLVLVFRVQCCPRTRELLGQPSFSTGKHRGRESKQPKPYHTPSPTPLKRRAKGSWGAIDQTVLSVKLWITESQVLVHCYVHPTPVVSGFFKSRPYRNFNPHRLHERGICPITRDCSCFHKCGVTKLHFISPVHSCFFHFKANLTPHVHPSLGKLPSLKRSDDVDVYFSVVSIYCQTTALLSDYCAQ